MTVTDRVFGAIGIVAVLLALFFLVRGGPEDGAAPAAAAVPRLRLLEPAAGSEVTQPLAVTFDAGTRVAPDGSAGDRHVHVRVGAYELMAGTGQIQRVEGTRYRWTLPPLAPGTHAVRLYWSGADHRPLAEGASDPVVVRLR